MRLPPRWARRVLLWPIPLVLTVLYVTTVPILLIAAFVISYRLPGRLRALRVLGLASVYLFVEAAVGVAALGLWIASGFGWKLRSPRFLAPHYQLLRWGLAVIVWAVKRLFELEIEADGPALPADDGDDSTLESPLVVMSRHAGPADSLLLLHQVMSWQGRRPRIVAKDLLQFAPALDIILNRLPNRFVNPNPSDPGATVRAIGELATGMTNEDAFVIFPEGGNFTEGRRLRAIDRLREGGHEEAARRAEAMRNVLPPRPAGTQAALASCPSADAVFVAHAGLDHLATIGDLWTAIPEGKTVEMEWYVIDSADIPSDPDGQGEMLARAWEDIDHWVEERKLPPLGTAAD